MVELRQKLLLIHDRINGSLGDYTGFSHLLHGKQFPLLALLHSPDFTKATTADYILKVKASLVLSYTGKEKVSKILPRTIQNINQKIKVTKVSANIHILLNDV